jgi:hypothetical protein
MTSSHRSLCVVALAALFVFIAGCDADISGEATAGQDPDTALAVRDSSLVDNICGEVPADDPCDEEDNLLTSTVFVSWTGTDPDGYIDAFELRFYNADAGVPEAGWTRTASRDSLILFPLSAPIDRVAFEVRAIDNEGRVDPTPARTIFPLRNSPPSIDLDGLELPPDTTWPVFSIAWMADDPEGPADVARIEVSLNDTESYVVLPREAEFATFVATDGGTTEATAEAEVFLGRAFQRSGITVPGLRLDAENTLYLRAVDQADEASEPDSVVWYVRQPKSDVLFVNDYRSPNDEAVLPFHRDALAGYLGGATFDEWDLSAPDNVVDYSEALPSSPEPTLAPTLALWDYIYWVSTSATDQTFGRNFVLAAEFLDTFFDEGGRLFINVPVRLASDPTQNLNNAALSLLPFGDVVEIDRTQYSAALDLFGGAAVTGVNTVPGTERTLPDLEATGFVSGAFPFEVEGTSSVGLYEAEFTVQTTGGQFVPWPGTSTVASMTEDRRIGLIGLPFVSELGNPRFVGAGGDEGAPRTAVQYMLEGLEFPGTPEN